MNFITILLQPFNITGSYANYKYIAKVKKKMGSIFTKYNKKHPPKTIQQQQQQHNFYYDTA